MQEIQYKAKLKDRFLDIANPVRLNFELSVSDLESELPGIRGCRTVEYSCTCGCLVVSGYRGQRGLFHVYVFDFPSSTLLPVSTSSRLRSYRECLDLIDKIIETGQCYYGMTPISEVPVNAEFFS